MNNLLARLDGSCQDQQSLAIYLSTGVICCFFLFCFNFYYYLQNSGNVSDISDGI